MKNVMMYYYNLEPNEIHQVGKEYHFFYQEQMYLFLPYNRPLEELNELHMVSVWLCEKGFCSHQIIKNEQGKLYTDLQGAIYVLLKVQRGSKSSICIGEIISLQKFTIPIDNYKHLHRQKWDILWSNKIDYFEYQISQFGKKYPVIRESFSYFSGLAENAIAYVHNLSEDSRFVLSHKRIKIDMTEIDLYNPLNFVIDDRTRDVAEYFKDKFFYGYLSFEEIKYYLLYCIDQREFSKFFARMLFPSYYFDIYEDIMANKKKEKDLLKVIHKTSLYEHFLFMICTFMNQYVYVAKPEWIGPYTE